VTLVLVKNSSINCLGMLDLDLDFMAQVFPFT
jgi:hypothetical protein